MHLPAFVVGQRVLLQTLTHEFIGDDHGFLVGIRVRHELEDVQQLACIASAEAQQGIGLAHLDGLLLQHDVFLQGSVHQLQQVVLPKGFQDVDGTPGEQRPDDLEGRVLRGGTNQGDYALLHGTEQRVLL